MQGQNYSHSFVSGLRVRNHATLSGCAYILGGAVTVDVGGTVLADCGGTQFFYSAVTNNGTIRAVNGSTVEAYGTLVNNGTIDVINGSLVLHGSFINKGTLLDASNVRISQVAVSGGDVTVRVPSATGHTYQLQWAPSLTPPTTWISGSAQPGSGGVLTFTDSGGTTNSERFYHVSVTVP
jgi:hypothetical protein